MSGSNSDFPNAIQNLEKSIRLLDETMNNVSRQWKDSRKNEYFNKYLIPLRDVHNETISELKMLSFNLRNIESMLNC